MSLRSQYHHHLTRNCNLLVCLLQLFQVICYSYYHLAECQAVWQNCYTESIHNLAVPLSIQFCMMYLLVIALFELFLYVRTT